MSAETRHSLDDVQRGIDRFMADFREFASLDHVAEFTEPTLCVMCGVYPVAYLHRCFGCHAKGALPA